VPVFFFIKLKKMYARLERPTAAHRPATMPFTTPIHRINAELLLSKIQPSSNATHASTNDISLDDASSYALSPASAREPRRCGACLLAADLAAESPESLPPPLAATALPLPAAARRLTTAMDKLIANYAVQVEDLK
jgi:hypothetical protein